MVKATSAPMLGVDTSTTTPGADLRGYRRARRGSARPAAPRSGPRSPAAHQPAPGRPGLLAPRLQRQDFVVRMPSIVSTRCAWRAPLGLVKARAAAETQDRRPIRPPPSSRRRSAPRRSSRRCRRRGAGSAAGRRRRRAGSGTGSQSGTGAASRSIACGAPARQRRWPRRTASAGRAGGGRCATAEAGINLVVSEQIICCHT